MTSSKRYVGLDISMTGPGFACVEVRDRRAYLIATDTITTTAKESDGKRLRKIATKLKNFMADNAPVDEIIKEQSFTKFKKETQKIFKTVGVFEYVLHQHDIKEYAATTIKLTVANNGKASKELVAESVCKYFDLPLDTFKKRDDESDAIGVVLTHLIKNDLIDWEVA